MLLGFLCLHLFIEFAQLSFVLFKQDFGAFELFLHPFPHCALPLQVPLKLLPHLHVHGLLTLKRSLQTDHFLAQSSLFDLLTPQLSGGIILAKAGFSALRSDFVEKGLNELIALEV